MTWRINRLSFSCILIRLFFSLSVRRPLTLSVFRFGWRLPPDLYASLPLNKLVPWLNKGFTESTCPSYLDLIIMLSGCSLTHIIILQREAYGIIVPSITATSTVHVPWMTDWRYIPDVWPILLRISNISRQSNSHTKKWKVGHSNAN